MTRPGTSFAFTCYDWACRQLFIREEYGLLESLGATKITPQLDDVFTYPETWEHISWASSLAGSQCLEHA